MRLPARYRAIAAFVTTASLLLTARNLAGAQTRSQRYVVARGDSLSGIGARTGCSIDVLRAANRIDGDRILAGQALAIPACEARTAATVATAPLPIQPAAVQPAAMDSTTLPALMRARGFNAPGNFRALVIEVTFGSPRRRIVQERYFDYAGTATDAHWNAASTVKLYAAIAALQNAERLGFSAGASLTFHGRHRAHHFALDELIRDAITPSNNIAFDFLVQFDGYDDLNGRFFSAENGFRHSALQAAYAASEWASLGESASFRYSPAITIQERGRTTTLPARSGTLRPDCSGAACTTLLELGDAMRRLMLQEQLPLAQSFGLSPHSLRLLRLALRAQRSNTNAVVHALGTGMRREGLRFYYKPGLAEPWCSNNVYVYDPRGDQAWIVALASDEHCSALTPAARVIGEILGSRALRTH